MARGLLPEWDCHKCTAGMKKARGCGVKGRTATLLGDKRLESCPLVFIRDNRHAFNVLMRYHALAATGVLPEAGGWNDQANAFTQAMAYLTAGINEVEAIRLADIKTKSSAPGAQKRQRRETDHGQDEG